MRFLSLHVADPALEQGVVSLKMSGNTDVIMHII